MTIVRRRKGRGQAISITPAPRTPTRSWWIEPRTRDEFERRLQAEQLRMTGQKTVERGKR